MIMKHGLTGYHLLWICIAFLPIACSTSSRQPVTCNEIRTKSYEEGVVTTTLILSPNPTVGEVLNCFGNPDSYFIDRLFAPDSSGIVLAMFYPKKGLTIGYVGYSAIREFNANSLLNRIVIMPSATITEMVHAEYKAPEEVLAKRKPWPNPFTSIELDK
jgi:hypothetical protein